MEDRRGRWRRAEASKGALYPGTGQQKGFKTGEWQDHTGNSGRHCNWPTVSIGMERWDWDLLTFTLILMEEKERQEVEGLEQQGGEKTNSWCQTVWLSLDLASTAYVTWGLSTRYLSFPFHQSWVTVTSTLFRKLNRSVWPIMPKQNGKKSVEIKTRRLERVSVCLGPVNAPLGQLITFLLDNVARVLRDGQSGTASDPGAGRTLPHSPSVLLTQLAAASISRNHFPRLPANPPTIL